MLIYLRRLSGPEGKNLPALIQGESLSGGLQKWNAGSGDRNRAAIFSRVSSKQLAFRLEQQHGPLTTLPSDPICILATCDPGSLHPCVEVAARSASPGSTALAQAVRPFPGALGFPTSSGSEGHQVQALSRRAVGPGAGPYI